MSFRARNNVEEKFFGRQWRVESWNVHFCSVFLFRNRRNAYDDVLFVLKLFVLWLSSECHIKSQIFSHCFFRAVYDAERFAKDKRFEIKHERFFYIPKKWCFLHYMQIRECLSIFQFFSDRHNQRKSCKRRMNTYERRIIVSHSLKNQNNSVEIRKLNIWIGTIWRFEFI